MGFCILNIAVAWDELAARSHMSRTRSDLFELVFTDLRRAREDGMLFCHMKWTAQDISPSWITLKWHAETFSLLHSARVKLTLGLIYSWGAGHEGKQKGYITTVYVAQIAPGFWMLSRSSNEKSEQSEAPRGFWFIRLVNKLACLET